MKQTKHLDSPTPVCDRWGQGRSLGIKSANLFVKVMGMNRWWLTVSTTACVVLFTMGTYAAIEAQRFAMAGLFLFFAFYLPLQTEAMRDKLLKRDFKMASDGKTVDEPRDAIGSHRIGH